MTSVHNVAAYILRAMGPMSAMKLQKLVYYSQAWSLVWDEKPLFGDEIEAWIGGPVVRALYAQHRGEWFLKEWTLGDPDKLSAEQRETIDSVLKFYGDKDPQWLSDLTHMEAPWQRAREGLSPTERGQKVIEKSWMAEYYSGLVQDSPGR